MSKHVVTALLLIALVVLVLVTNNGTASVNLLLLDVSASKPVVFLGFTAIGTMIGLLLK